MAITKTIGGNRVGSGKKMQAHLHNYYRSTHNLSEKFASSMGSGILYPAMCKLAMRGDTFDIAIDADARTIPTMGPLFGTYKMQVDVYQCPVRLYQSILHNNPLAIGLNMSQILFPQLNVKCKTPDKDRYKFSNSSLLKYLGMSGIGTPVFDNNTITETSRRINAIPALAYYDIFKTYYANKQEEKGYVITNNWEGFKNGLLFIEIYQNGQRLEKQDYNEGNKGYNAIPYNANANYRFYIDIKAAEEAGYDPYEDFAAIKKFFAEHITIEGSGDAETIWELYNGGHYIDIKMYKWKEYFELSWTILENERQTFEQNYTINGELFNVTSNIATEVFDTKIVLREFDLSKIDDMRYDILSHHTLGSPFVIKKDNESTPYLPYSALVSETTYDPTNQYTVSNNYFAENGLVLKTYQNDIFNNWLNADWIEGENGIAELSKVEVVDGAFTMDALNFAQKLYNMLNRIAIAGATYEDWQDVVYEEVKRKQIESPIFCGGMSQEVVFDEIVQTSMGDEDNPLGSLGGRGRLNGKRKGGKLHIKCDEACFIIAIVSLTPRIFYTQGNEFYLTDVMSMDDIHKPAMDGIGFQDLIGERIAWWDTKIKGDSIQHRSKIGKLPSWIEYMTSVDRAYGDFAETSGRGYMILNRNYERDEETDGIKDATTYIDPAKYNYAFAYKALESQNFWVEIKFDIKARRLMSARLIPNV